jgi:hypothetical protein
MVEMFRYWNNNNFYLCSQKKLKGREYVIFPALVSLYFADKNQRYDESVNDERFNQCQTDNHRGKDFS